jgi:hypothetical protein
VAKIRFELSFRSSKQLDHLSRDSPVALDLAHPPAVKAAPRVLLAHRGGRLPAAQEEVELRLGGQVPVLLAALEQLLDRVLLQHADQLIVGEGARH